MVDISGSESFGSKKQFKKDIVTEIAATMAFQPRKTMIKLILFSDQIELYIPKDGRARIAIIRELIEFQPQSYKTDIARH
jgi:hypothetical protein